MLYIYSMRKHLKQYASVYLLLTIGIVGVTAAAIYLFNYVLPNLK